MRELMLYQVIVAALVVGLFAVPGVQAGPRGARFRKRADKNKDGVVTKKERVLEKKRVVKKQAEVDTKWEAKADKNNDGIVQAAEAKKAVRKKYLRKRSDVDRPWEKKADKNEDGTVDGTELRAYHLGVMDTNGDGKIGAKERKLYWKKKRAVADTELKKKYDTDENGYLSWQESRKMLRNKLKGIASNGFAVVDTDIELEFDTNGDGILDKDEAEKMKEALDQE